jgi:hypothetical protein
LVTTATLAEEIAAVGNITSRMVRKEHLS